MLYDGLSLASGEVRGKKWETLMRYMVVEYKGDGDITAEKEDAYKVVCGNRTK